MRRLVCLALLLPFLLAPAPATSAPAAAVPAFLETDKVTRPVAPGLTLTSFDRIDSAGWLRADALSADLGRTSVDYLYSGSVSTPEPLSGPANRAHAVAAVNGDFFDINNSSAAQGIGIQNGQLIQSPVSGHTKAIGVTAQGIGKVIEVYFEGTAGDIALTQFNNLVSPGGVGLFTPLWGSYPRRRAVEGATKITEVSLVNGIVTTVSATPGSGPIPAGTSILLGRDAAADTLAALTIGQRIEVRYQPRASDGSQLNAAIGGNVVLVRDGVPQPNGDPTLAPRTAVGFSADGRTMHLLTIDGRQADSRGVTLTEMGQLMAELGAHHALNLDGGGSSTLLAREPGSAQVQVENQPSDGGERPVPNGLALYAPAGSGSLSGYWVQTTTDPKTAPGLSPIRGGRPDRVFPGLTRRLTAAGFDETYGPAAGTPHWRVSTPWHGIVLPATAPSPGAGGGAAGAASAGGSGAAGTGREAVFRGALPGAATVTAFTGAATGTVKLTVIGPLTRISPTADKLALAGANSETTFGVVGFDSEARGAPIEPADLRLDYDTSLMTVTARPDGLLNVKALKDVGAGLITVHVGASTAVLAVTIGLADVMVADFDNASQWFYNSIPADIPGSVSPAPGHTGTGLRLSADFTRHSVTRAAYANPPTFIDVPGQPQAFTMWINGTGNGEWASLHLVDANGAAQVLRGGNVTWTGWQEVTFTVPAGIRYPVKVRRFYAPEIKADARYQSELVIDDLVAKVPPSIELPVTAPPTDRTVVTDGTLDDAPWRFAVMSDAQFVAANPDSDLVAGARRTLREIKAATPDFLVINGDFVDTAFPADFALAKKILDEELGGALPYYYIPGNHEIMGAPITNFETAFGATNRVLDHRGTRFVMLNSSDGALHLAQLALLRDALATATTNVVVMHHHPHRDPTPNKGSQLGDRKEAALLEKWLADFETASGKQALFIGAHVGTFHAERVDGVPYFINGNTAKAPATPAGEGGFTGWTMFGSDLRAQTRPHVDTLSLTAPTTVAAGQTAAVTATLGQGTRLVPVTAPVSADWSGSANLHIGPWWELRPWHIAWLDPATGALTTLRPGTVTVSVRVSAVTTTSTTITIT
ncbi:hypothetical protein Rhe02_22540 [Rhizocola hellebori]|uniref:Multidrug transporter n=1 Tax=Rhizocola hellebori TaxID=1392758 RepID=A0A8J3Q699_9ACTN|nr:phosphodiester glycosidase family protein [Rhizocola hellebori]GIH04187.1 hypothetical protein Rhe02_22540 [Rhizocola hellebori]